MSSELPYPIFKCILEYLEANKRIHICSRSKALQKIDKKIPLHIKRLTFTNFSMTVNHISISHDVNNSHGREEVLVDGVFRNWDEVIMPGDVSMGDWEFFKLSNTDNLEIRNQKFCELVFSGNKTKESRVVRKIPYDVALKKVATALFEGRCSIHVSELAFIGHLFRLPVGFNIRIRNSLYNGSSNIDDILCMIDPQSFPLKTIKLGSSTPENYSHPIVQAAETLDTFVDRRRHLQELSIREVLTFPHKHLKVILFDLNCEESVSVVQDWLDHPREHGRTFTIGWTKGMVEILCQIKKRVNGKVVLIPGNTDKKIYPKAVIIPIDSTSEILISIVENQGIKLESIPTGTIQSTVDLTYEVVLWWRSSRIQERFEEDETFAVIIFVFAFLVFCFGFLCLFLHASYYGN